MINMIYIAEFHLNHEWKLAFVKTQLKKAAAQHNLMISIIDISFAKA